MNPRIFFDSLQKSGLLSAESFRDALVDCRKANDEQPLGDLDLVCRVLVEQGYLTTWQVDKLRKGKHRGFFLGKYKLLGHIGTGGMSSVYLAEHTLMKQQRAIKVLPRSRVDDPTYLRRFYLEARASAALRHPNIVQSFDVDCEDQNHFIVMEFVDGKDLNLTVKEEGPLDFALAANLVGQAALGLASAHKSGVIHRDIKPGNLLVDRSGQVKILDMGLALYSNDTEAPDFDNDEKMLGTADYLAPEQSRDSRTVSERADIYALGCTLYYLIAGHAPFPEGSIAERITHHRHRMPPRLSEIRSECPRALEEICWKMIQKNPDHRFQTADEVLAGINAWLVSIGCEAVEVDKKPAMVPSFIGTQNSASLTASQEPASSSDLLISGLVDAKQKAAHRPTDSGVSSDKPESQPTKPSEADSPTVSVTDQGTETHPSRLPGAESSIVVAKPNQSADLAALDSGAEQLLAEQLLAPEKETTSSSSRVDEKPNRVNAQSSREAAAIQIGQAQAPRSQTSSAGTTNSLDDFVMLDLAAMEAGVESQNIVGSTQGSDASGKSNGDEKSHFLLRLPAWIMVLAVLGTSILGLLLLGLIIQLLN